MSERQSRNENPEKPGNAEKAGTPEKPANPVNTAKLEKQLAMLRKKLERSEWHRSDLENQHDRDQHLYQRMHAELEAAHRGAQIQAALERVRARAMAMRKPEDLSGIGETVFTELKALGFVDIRNTEIIINHESESSITSYYYSDYGVTGVVDVDYRTNPILSEWAHKMQSADDAFAEVVIGEDEIDAWRAYRMSLGYLADPKLDEAASVYYYSYSTGLGALSISSFRPVSAEQLDTLLQFRNVFNLAYQRYVDIARAEAQAREAQIEVALERVRARAMAMHTSEELLDVVFTIHHEYAGLGFPCGAFWQTRYTDESYHKALTGIDGKKLAAIMDLPRDFAANPALASWERGDETIGVFKFDTDAACEYHHHMVTKGKFLEVDPEAITQDMIRENHGWTFVQARTSHGEIGYSLWGETEPTREAKEVLVRFARTFDLAYRRFEDLKNAEAQTREVEIELALERVRAKTMAMQKSADISRVAHVLYQQLESLGGNLWGTGFAFCTEDSKSDEFWFVNQGGVLPTVSIPNTEDPVHRSMYQGWKNGLELFTAEKGGDELKAHYEYMLTVPDVTDFFQGILDSGIAFPTWQKWHAAYFSDGYLLVITVAPYEDEQIFVRFAKVFEQAYIRFRDLQMAEAQNRESQVQLALERIRTQSMRMQHSSELIATSTAFHEQLLDLGVASEFSYVWLPDEAAGKHQFWATWAEAGEEGSPAFRSKAVTYDLDKSEPYTAACFEAWESDQPIFVDFVPPADVEGFFAAWPDLLSGVEHMRVELFKGGLYYAEAYMRFGCFGINIRPEPTEAERDIIRRFANEFEQAYTRFLDLKKAESSAREATRQAALDRVRAEIASMRTAADLERITPLVWRELTTLGVPFFRCGVFIIDESSEEIEAYLTTPGGESLAAMRLPYDISPTTEATVARWRQHEVYTTHWDRSQFAEWVQTISDRGVLQESDRYRGGEEAPDSLALHFLPFEQGMLYVGSAAPLDQEELGSAQTLADAFAVAYARYEDFQKLEAKNREVEQAMTNLRAAQAQLVQSEKMASLGQLTAGIAHEIKNPLNFVNNFAELTKELVEELDTITDADERREILDNIKSNAASIEEHGRRADSIVRAMMEHARSGSGQRIGVDVNSLVEEYANLAYHGMRARHPEFEPTLVQKLDDKAGEVEVVAQDIGRVLINLLDNAFDAVRTRATTDNNSYAPTVSISTRRSNDQVIVRVQDNGPGMPEDVRSKIFEPFYTTKPTGEGTGLGLSLSHDIVAQGHGGTLEVESEEGGGAAFIVAIPLTPVRVTT